MRRQDVDVEAEMLPERKSEYSALQYWPEDPQTATKGKVNSGRALSTNTMGELPLFRMGGGSSCRL